jgi:hypothetical protein
MMKAALAGADIFVTRGEGELFRLEEGVEWARPGISTLMIFRFGRRS